MLELYFYVNDISITIFGEVVINCKEDMLTALLSKATGKLNKNHC